MPEDLDDTVVAPARRAEPPTGPDLDDTVIPVGARPAPELEVQSASPVPSVRTTYAYRIGEGDAIDLDRPSYIGRRPSVSRISSGDVPRLVRVASPRREVSATHLEVRQIGGTVVVTDLRSTNGSVVMLPGSVPRKLRQGESVVVQPGTLVDIGDDNVIQILPMQRTGSQRKQEQHTERQP